jgi:imidazolonepropionase-like amidohydrolase
MGNLLVMGPLLTLALANGPVSVTQTAQKGDLVVFAGAVIDGTGAAPLRDAAIVVRDGVIRSVGPRRGLAVGGARVLDRRDGWVLPGLADMHVHFGNGGLMRTDSARLDRVLRQFPFYGVTTVLNLGATHGTLDSLAALRSRITDGSLEGPTILGTGGLITVPGSHPVGTIMFPPADSDSEAYDWTLRGVFVVSSTAEMKATVDRLAARGADAVKIVIESGPPPFGDHHPQMSPALAAAAVEAGHAHGLRVFAHASSVDELEVALEARVDGVVHLVRHPSTPNAALLARMREAGLWYVPTMGIHVWPDVWGDPGDQLSDPFLRAGVDPGAIASLLDSPRLPRAAPAAEDWAARRAAVAALAAAHRAGVRIVGGSDVSNPAIFPGYSMHHELSLMVEAGMSPMEAIVASTSRAAEMIGREDFGAIRPGRRADLLILSADPLKDITNTRAIRDVVVRGRVLERSLSPGPSAVENGNQARPIAGSSKLP